MIIVSSNKDNIIKVESKQLSKFTNNEIITFSNGEEGFIVNAKEKHAYVALMDYADHIKIGSKAKKSNRPFSIDVNSDFLGKIYNFYAKNIYTGIDEVPIKTIYKLKKNYKNISIESHITRIDSRKEINKSLLFGKIIIDSTLAVGRGQRQLIIGDRETGKTALALSAILAQKKTGVICIYVSIGRKKTDIINVYKILKKNDALKYTAIFASPSSDTAAANYIIPYTAMSVAEKFKDEGRDVLIIFDDLSMHARAYRSISLLSGSSVGREGYPGDIFYIHSRLLERAGNFNEKYGGGSITALPIIETQSEDISGYISTNIISITDGQIFTSNKKFNLYERPAINVDLSVSRVGSKAQFKSIREESKSLKSIISQANQIMKTMSSEENLSPVSQKIISKYRVLNTFSIQNVEHILNPAYELVYLIILNWGILESFDDKDLERVKNALYEFINKNKTAHEFVRFLDREINKDYKYDKDLVYYYVKSIFGPFFIWLSFFLYGRDTFEKIDNISEYDTLTFDEKVIFNFENENKVNYDNILTRTINIKELKDN